LEIQLPEEDWSVIESLVAAGRFSSAEDAILEAVRLLAVTEKLRSQVQVGITQADQGDVHEHDTVL
jgi:putative addiction module CopG family antidote